MGKIGTTELLIVLAIVLVIFGPKALPKLGRSLGKTLGGFKKGLNEDADDDDDEEVVVVKKKKKAKAQAEQQAAAEAESADEPVNTWPIEDEHREDGGEE